MQTPTNSQFQQINKQQTDKFHLFTNKLNHIMCCQNQNKNRNTRSEPKTSRKRCTSLIQTKV
ncbi:hypothetical protein HanIR_Chr03g0145251 [Helianthus annuus]|nr:hypothetical protein HanIR_Chr03g0145251 [Helianthus annuus]